MSLNEVRYRHKYHTGRPLEMTTSQMIDKVQYMVASQIEIRSRLYPMGDFNYA